MSHTDSADSDLTRCAIAGDESAFTELMRRHKEAAYRVALRNLDDPDEAYDAVQEAFVSAWRNLGRYDPNRPFRTWFFRIVVNKCRDRRRRRRVRAFFFNAESLETPAVANTIEGDASAEQSLLAREELRRTLAAISRLPETQRQAFILSVIEGLPQGETAEILGITVKAVETRIARARKQIAAELSDAGAAD